MVTGRIKPERRMLKFFFADYGGAFLLALFVIAGALIYRQQWLYGALGLIAFVLYLAAVFIYGTTHKQ